MNGIRLFLMLFMICLLTGFTVSAQNPEDTVKLPTIVARYLPVYDFISLRDSIYTFQSEFILPENYHYVDSADFTAYQNWMANFPIWHKYKPVGHWKGTKKYEADEISRVVHLPWRSSRYTDAGFPLRILAEYLHYMRMEDNFSFKPAQGDELNFVNWLESKPAYTSRGEIILQPGEKRERTPLEYYSLVHFCMDNINYAVLSDNCIPIESTQVRPGDLYIAHDESGKTGRAFVIMNMIQQKGKEDLFVYATGCDDGCDFHIPLVNEKRENPWLTLDRIQKMAGDFAHAGFYRLKIINELE